jgi:hypothetical protein
LPSKFTVTLPATEARRGVVVLVPRDGKDEKKQADGGVQAYNPEPKIPKMEIPA